MAPFSMRCTSCGEFIYKGRKFNARKETAEERYLDLAIYRFYIKCTRCSGEIVFKTDPRHMDYKCERGAKRNFEPWREPKEEITDEQHLNNLQAMEAEAEGEKEGDTMQDLEERTKEARKEMDVADALDDVRARNARREAKAKDGDEVTVQEAVDWERERQQREDEEAAKLAFQSATGDRIKRLVDEDAGEQANGVHRKNGDNENSDAPSFTFTKAAKPKKDFAAALGVKKSTGSVGTTPIAPVAVAKPNATTIAAARKPALLAGYDSDSD
jgi:molybdopterin converting factor small subunit